MLLFSLLGFQNPRSATREERGKGSELETPPHLTFSDSLSLSRYTPKRSNQHSRNRRHHSYLIPSLLSLLRHASGRRAGRWRCSPEPTFDLHHATSVRSQGPPPSPPPRRLRGLWDPVRVGPPTQSLDPLRARARHPSRLRQPRLALRTPLRYSIIITALHICSIDFNSTTCLFRRSAISNLFSSLAGLIVQPLVGHLSDRLRVDSPLGRRRPFIAGGAASIATAVLIVGFSADLGKLLGDSQEPGVVRPRAVVVYVIGFWLLDVGNNATQGPCRALLADLTGEFNFSIKTLNFYFIRLYLFVSSSCTDFNFYYHFPSEILVLITL